MGDVIMGDVGSETTSGVAPWYQLAAGRRHLADPNAESGKRRIGLRPCRASGPEGETETRKAGHVAQL